MWTFGYFEEMGITVHDDYILHNHNGKQFYITHGDGKGKGHRKYLVIKSLLRSKIGQYLFSCIHPTLGLSLMKRMSSLSRDHSRNGEVIDHRHIKEYAVDLSESVDYDFFICGHQHDAQVSLLNVDPKKTYVNLGDWMSLFTYAVWNGNDLKIEKFKK